MLKLVSVLVLLAIGLGAVGRAVLVGQSPQASSSRYLTVAVATSDVTQRPAASIRAHSGAQPRSWGRPGTSWSSGCKV